MEKLFENILDEDEKVVKVLKPNKAKYFFGVMFGTCAMVLFFLALSLLAMFVPEEGFTAPPAIYCLIPISVGIVVIALAVLFTYLSYTKRHYAYTNKRIIIRCGIIGTDYKSLDMDMIGAINVNVSIFDKLLRKNTGTVAFGSLASPMTNNGSMFSFYSITDPYSFYKEIKLVINNMKKQEKPKQRKVKNIEE